MNNQQQKKGDWRLQFDQNSIQDKRSLAGGGDGRLRLDVCIGLQIVVKLLGGVSCRRDDLV